MFGSKYVWLQVFSDHILAGLIIFCVITNKITVDNGKAPNGWEQFFVKTKK